MSSDEDTQIFQRPVRPKPNTEDNALDDSASEELWADVFGSSISSNDTTESRSPPIFVGYVYTNYLLK